MRSGFVQESLYQCSHWRASASVGGPNLLTSEDIYQEACKVDSHVSRSFPTFHLKNRRILTQFTNSEESTRRPSLTLCSPSCYALPGSFLSAWTTYEIDPYHVQFFLNHIVSEAAKTFGKSHYGLEASI
jgi:hypothetical protein